MPAQKAFGAPLMTTAPTEASASAASKASTMLSAMAGLKALRRSGAFRPMMATPSVTSYSISVFTPSSRYLASLRPGGPQLARKMPLAMISRWISLVPSPMDIKMPSRQ